jgi:hypothetical protein
LHRAQEPRFPVGIQPRTFELVVDTLKKLNYSGPVALSCDDSKLLPSLQPYYDENRKAHFIMGHFGEEMQVADPEAFRHMLASAKLVKATKVRLSKEA